MKRLSSLIPAHEGKGYVLNRLKRYEEALIACEEAIRLDPTHAPARSGKDKALAALKDSRRKR